MSKIKYTPEDNTEAMLFAEIDRLDGFFRKYFNCTLKLIKFGPPKFKIPGNYNYPQTRWAFTLKDLVFRRFLPSRSRVCKLLKINSECFIAMDPNLERAFHSVKYHLKTGFWIDPTTWFKLPDFTTVQELEMTYDLMGRPNLVIHDENMSFF